ncbi:hypothetical protein CARUB_v10004587mg [Capsella rubella]|uniref:HTH La-type RNA-binding domain-containing protein n=1 Tax=Capsella rubella TaxID=81985 RepID=R0GVU7_9BRAS|nr:la-related protein 1C [Capsella rubella]EOA16435.1 hypothetical protein CARUB_v10004587mg [Capsella rubella]
MASATSNSSISSSMSPRRMTENHGSPNAAVSQSPRRPSRLVSSPWTQIVRGESEPIAAAAVAAPSSPQSRAPIEPVASVSASATPDSVLTVEAAARDEKSEESGGLGNAGKKPVWKRPSNGASSEGGPVMGASSWPALSETTKAPSNKSSSDSLKSLGDVPSSSSPSPTVPVSQGIANAPVPAPKQAVRANPNPTPNHSRQRSFKRNGASGSANGTVSQPSVQGSFAELPLHSPSPRGQHQKNGFASQTHGGSDNLPQRDSYRNQNGNHHQSHGGRRNQEHGNQNWGYNRSFNGREGNGQSQRPAFVRHAPPPVQPIPPQFMTAQPIQPYASPVPFPPDMAASYYPRIPFMTPLAHGPVFYHVQDPPLHIKLQNQIQYYFSDENLVTDVYLRSFMDENGFVPLRVVAGFKKVAELTDSIQQIVEALQNSPVVEVQGDLIRKRHNWGKWVIQMKAPAESSPQSVDRADAVGSRLGKLSLDQSSADTIGGSSSQLQPREALSDVDQQSSGVAPASNHNDSDGANR